TGSCRVWRDLMRGFGLGAFPLPALGPNGFERTYMLEGTAGECEPQAIGRIVAKMVADGPLIRHSGLESREKQGRRRFCGGRFLVTRALRSHAAFAPYTSVTAILHSLCSRCTATTRSPSTLKVMVLQHRGHNQKYWKWRNVPAYSKPFSSPD